MNEQQNESNPNAEINNLAANADTPLTDLTPQDNVTGAGHASNQGWGKWEFNHNETMAEDNEAVRRIIDVTENLALFYNPANGHHSLRALARLPLNAVLHTFSAREFVRRPTYLSVQVADDKHIHLAPEFLQYINHSCEPNTFFDTKKGEVVAVRNIAPNEEITFFYPSTEWSMTQPFECFCGAGNCLGQIQGAAHLSKQTLAKYRFAEHLQHKLSGRFGEYWKTTRELALNTVVEPLRAAWLPAMPQEAFCQR